MVKILLIAGARPNFVKIAPLMQALRAWPDFDARLVHTGQHYDEAMSGIFFDELGIPSPDYELAVGPGTRREQIERIMARFEPVLVKEQPDTVLVVGDVNSTVACARVARRHGTCVVHVEAGLRSFDETMPEEVNRVETDQISDYLFVTEPSGVHNLATEKVSGKVFLVGNVMIDSLLRHLDKALALETHLNFGLAASDYLVGTFHRPSNVDSVDRLSNVVRIVRDAAQRRPLVLPLHPRTRQALHQHRFMAELEANPQVMVTDPLGYLDFLALIARARAIVTDSGGVQDEATFLKVPCITMRENTERPLTVEVGSNELAGTDATAVVSAIDKILAGRQKTARVPDLWDGRTAERVAAILARELIDVPQAVPNYIVGG